MRKLLVRLYPELLLFPDREAANEALATANREDRSHWFVVMVTIIILICYNILLRLFPHPAVYSFVPGGVLLLTTGLFPTLCWFPLLRRNVRRALRSQLVKHGIPICIPCGYDPTGNVSGRCSECGAPVQKPVPNA
jgi:hypothetical protein